MIRLITQKWVDGKLFLDDASCDSTDTKPTDNIFDGSIIRESDTGKVFFFSEESGEWVEQFSFQS